MPTQRFSGQKCLGWRQLLHEDSRLRAGQGCSPNWLLSKEVRRKNSCQMDGSWIPLWTKIHFTIRRVSWFWYLQVIMRCKTFNINRGITVFLWIDDSHIYCNCNSAHNNNFLLNSFQFNVSQVVIRCSSVGNHDPGRNPVSHCSRRREVVPAAQGWQEDGSAGQLPHGPVSSCWNFSYLYYYEIDFFKPWN